MRQFHKFLIPMVTLVALLLPGVARAQGAATLPYSTGFETTDDNSDWSIINGSQTNKWFMGTAAHNSGSQGLYISDNSSGTTNNYDGTSTSVVFAVRTIDFSVAGQYAISFDWRCYGESTYDYLRCFLVPSSTTFTAGTLPSGVTASGTPSGWIDLGGKMNLGGATWNNTLETFNITTPGTMKLVFLWNNDLSVANQQPAAVDNLQIAAISCPLPTNITYTIDGTISWTAGGTETEWLYRLNNDAWISTNTTSVQFNDLNANTQYTFTVRAVCGVDDTSMGATLSFLTPCGALTALPYVQNFDNATTGGSTSATFVNCMTRLNNGTSYFGFPYVGSSTYNHTPGGSKGLYWYNSTTTGTYGDYQIIALPGVDGDLFTMDQLQLSFWSRPSSTSYSPQFQVGVMTNPNDASTFVAVATVNVANNTNWQFFEVPLTSYTGTGTFAAIRALRPTSSWYAYVDDITLEAQPTCPRPTDLALDSATTTDLYISWADNTQENYQEYIIEYRSQGSTSWLSTTEYGTTATLSGLTSNTAYDIRVFANCGSGDTSAVAEATFRTECDLISQLPYSENFESAPVGSSSTGSAFVPCWTRLNNGTSYGGYPYVGNSTTYNHTSGGSKGLYWYNTSTTGSYGDYLYAVLPPVDTNLYPINTLMLNFWAKPSSTSYSPQFQVGVMSDPTDINTFVLVHNVNVQNITDWQEFSVLMGQYVGNGNYVAIRTLRSSSAWTAYMDDITLTTAPTCAPIVSHSVTSTVSAALLNWEYDTQYPNAPTGYTVSYDFTSNNGANPTTISVTGPTLTLTGLDDDTNYTVTITTDCDANAVYTFQFSTMALPCAEWDDSGTGFGGPADTLTVSTPGTSTTNVMPVNNGYNYSYCQHLILSSEIPSTGPQAISGIAFEYAYTQPMTHATNCLIYMGNTTRSNFNVSSGSSADSMFVPYNQLTLVYQGPLNCTVNGYNYFTFNQGVFQYDGTSNIVVAIVNNSGSYDGTAYVFRYQQTSGSAMSHRVYNNSTPYGPVDMDAARAGQSYWRTNMKLTTGGGGDCVSLATCSAPAAQLLQDDNGDYELSWIPGYQETSWDVEYRTSSATTWTSLLTNTTQTSYTFLSSDLLPATDYLFRVTANCSDTTISTTVAYTTPCSMAALPYMQNFDNITTSTSTTNYGLLPNCWDYVLTGSSTYQGQSYQPRVYYSTSNSNSGNYCLYLYGVGYFMLPPMSAPLDSLTLTFNDYISSAYYGLEVGVMENGNFVSVQDVTSQLSVSTHNPVEVSFANYHGTSRTIAFRNYYTSSTTTYYSYHYIDDIVVDYLPSCPRVIGVATRSLTDNSAVIEWTGNGNYEVEYGPAGFMLGTGTTTTVTAADSIDIQNLTSNTYYDIYVREICASGEGYGAWSFVHHFHTECDLLSVLPFVETFENATTGTSTTGSPFAECWTRLNNGTSYGGYPYVSSTSTYNHTSGGTKGLYWYNTTTATTYGDYQYIVLPHIDATTLPINTLQLSFWAKASSSSYYPVFEVGVMNSNTDTAFQRISTINVGNSTNWEEYTTTFSDYTGNGSYIAIRALRPTSSWYAYVDDIRLEILPDCPRVVEVTVPTVGLQSAVVSWYDTSSNSAWIVEYDTVNFIPGSGASHYPAITVSGDTSYMLTGLDSGTVYHVYVYPDCNGAVADRYVRFTTLAGAPATVPYACNFEQSGVNGWTLENGTQTNYWMVGNATGNGGRSLYVTNDGTSNSFTITTTSYVFAIRDIEFASAGEYAFSYDWKCQGESSYDFIRAALVPAGTNFEAGSYCGFNNASAMPVGGIALDGGYRLNLQGSWQNLTGTFNITQPGTYKWVFMWRNDGSGGTQPPAAIDNVTIMQNTCPMVQSFTALPTANSIDLTWSAGGNETSWLVTVGSTSTVVTSPSYTATGLTPNTNYTVSIRAICGAGDSSMAYTETIHTPCVAVSLPYSENFDNVTTSTSTTNYGLMADCWSYTLTGSSTYQAQSYWPRVYYSTSYPHSGNYCLYLYGECNMMLPPMPTSLDSLQLTFWDYTTSTSYGLEVGVMEGNNFIPLQTISTPTSTHVEYTVYFGNYTGNSRIIAFHNYYTTSSTSNYSYHYIDNVEVDYLPTCPPVMDITAANSTTSSLTIDWTDLSSAQQWEVKYGPQGFNQNQGTTITVSQHPTTITGLDSASLYDVYVRPLCSATDIGDWEMATLMTGICEGMAAFYTGNNNGSAYYLPLNNYYNYTLTETIIDSAELAHAGFSAGSAIASIAYSYSYSSASTVKTDVDIWIQPTTKTVFASTSDIEAINPATAIQAYHGDLNCSQGWNYFQFQDTLPITWDGHSNLLIIVDDNSYDYDGSSYTFNYTNCNGYKSICYYSDSDNPNAHSQSSLSSYSGSKTYYNYRPTMRLISCGNASCAKPNLQTVSNIDYQGATLNWSGNATDYEVSWKASNATNWEPEVTVTGVYSYTVSGLLPATQYVFRVRALCNPDEEVISDWSTGIFTTDSLPCFAPTALHVVDSAYTTVTLGWTVGTSETSWNVHVWNSTFDSTYTVNSNPATLGGLADNTGYSAAVAALCGGLVESEYSDTISFMTALCAVPTGLTATNITTNSATITWNGTASSYELQYGPRGFNEGAGTIVTVNGTNYNLTGLDSETEYDVSVRAACDEANGVYSTYTARYGFETETEVIGIASVDGLNVNIYPNPTSNSTNITLSGVTGEVTIAIIDMNGRTVRSTTMSCDGDCATTIEVSDLASGAYYVRISGAEVNTVKKLVVK
ncbi:MAG: fibronectin type III domain-containing protein [Bacteroidales bacterium]|nr:fibronectin type III domain-containing protein [Bacteroidales bacterium]